jgi:predicted nucleotide-binding protein (sugar kinase/HSP70/actin superfamily)
MFYVLELSNIKKNYLKKEVAERTAKISQQKEAIEKNLEKMEFQKAEIAEKNEEILVARNRLNRLTLT